MPRRQNEQQMWTKLNIWTNNFKRFNYALLGTKWDLSIQRLSNKTTNRTRKTDKTEKFSKIL